MAAVYNKLVRDEIPRIIRERGARPVVRTLDDKEYGECLSRKLLEEAEEFCQSGAIEELCDVLEVVDAILRWKGVSPEQAEEIRREKAGRNGAFEKRIFLESVEEV